MRCSYPRCSSAPSSWPPRSRRSWPPPASAAPTLERRSSRATSRRRRSSASSSRSTASASRRSRYVDIYVDDIAAAATATPSRRPPTTARSRAPCAAPFIESGQRAVHAARWPSATTPDEHGLGDLEGHAALGRAGAREGLDARARALPRARLHHRARPTAAPVYAHYVFAGKSRKHGADRDCRPAPAGPSRSKRRQFPFKKSPRVGVWTIQFDQEPVYNPKARGPRPADDQGPQDDQAAAGSGSLTRVRVKRRPPSSASTATRSPAANSPLSRPSASGSTSHLEITRLSGRAP